MIVMARPRPRRGDDDWWRTAADRSASCRAGPMARVALAPWTMTSETPFCFTSPWSIARQRHCAASLG